MNTRQDQMLRTALDGSFGLRRSRRKLKKLNQCFSTWMLRMDQRAEHNGN
jgi:hypothetical protein